MAEMSLLGQSGGAGGSERRGSFTLARPLFVCLFVYFKIIIIIF